MRQSAEVIRKKRIIFTVGFIVLTVASYYINEKIIMPHYSQYIKQAYLAQKLAVAALYVWFGYALGIDKQTTWFMGLLAILPIVSWIGLLYLLYKSGQMLLEAKKGTDVQTSGLPTKHRKEYQPSKQKTTRPKSKRK
ncbi:hypothetical protein Desca_0934 [Desulfotomaculum nigrificans CO-1-SRB]|uniref:Uncharacterized protein n=1 Tax=Desulfotomaculum nigrificans (strain DSM 14880 / VKM B-2319 / CO-1-SRB) TaxID=868595 RepID=F6B9W2_DESCC|nr:hypothetical protein [Desulfotomaculum nigrificans]AEF93810.1 hypothetical protein Desca_0934 [Desulfotomaculum nigrificans CO-1-SRB]